MLQFNVNKQIITRIDNEQPVGNSSEYLTASFTFSEDWANTVKTAYFKKQGSVNEPYLFELDADDEIKESERLNLEPGTWAVYVWGVLGTKEIPTNTVQIFVKESGLDNGEPFPIKPQTFGQWVKEKIDWLLSLIIVTGDGTKFFANDGTYKEIQGGGGGTYTTDDVEPTLTRRYVPETPINADIKFLNGNAEWTQISVGSGGYSAPLYYTTIASDVSGYRKIMYEPQVTEVEIPVTISNQEILLRSYIYDYPIETTIINSGKWVFTFTPKVSNANGVTKFRAEVFVRHLNGTETVLFTQDSSEINNTDYVLISNETTQPSFTVIETDRIGVKYYASTTSQSSITLTVIIGDGRGGYFTTPLATRHSQLRDKNGEDAYQHITLTEKSGLHTHSNKSSLDLVSGINTGNETVNTLGSTVNLATAKATPIDADMVPVMDSASSNVIKKLSWLNIKATLKTYFDTLYNNYSLDNAKLSTVLSSATAEATIADDDTIPLTDTSASNATKKITWSNIKAVLKTYFDTLYPSITDYVLDSASTGTVSKELVSAKTIKISTALTSLTLTLPSSNTWHDNYSIEFCTASLTLPSGVVWDGGTAPTLSATKWYLVTIFDGIAFISQGATK